MIKAGKSGQRTETGLSEKTGGLLQFEKEDLEVVSSALLFTITSFILPVKSDEKFSDPPQAPK